jgi:hypothetical protein
MAGERERLLEVAAEHATTRVPTASPGQSAGRVRGARIESLMDADPPTVEPGADQEVAAWLM